MREILSGLKLLPNLITLSRLIMVIPIALFFSAPSLTAKWIVLSLLFLSYLSDFLDGFIARWLKQESRLGLMLDPLVDKIWTFTMIILLVKHRSFPIWIGTIIVIRDFFILFMNMWLLKRRRSVLSSDEWGRKYMMLLGFLIIAVTIEIPHTFWLAYGVVLIAPITMISYLSQAFSGNLTQISVQLLKEPQQQVRRKNGSRFLRYITPKKDSL